MKTFLLALQFLTSITIKSDLTADSRDLVRSASLYPLIGLIIGAILACGHYLFDLVWLPMVSDGLTVVLLIALTRALHLDGVGDTLDGVLGSSSRERALEIMKDTRLGTYGTVGIIAVILLKFIALSSIPDFAKLQALIVFPVLSRFSIVQLAWRTPYAREKGLGGSVVGVLNIGHVTVAFFTALIVSFMVMRSLGLICLAIVIIITFLYRSLFMWKLGGITGDVLGCVNEFNETMVLLLISGVARYFM